MKNGSPVSSFSEFSSRHGVFILSLCIVVPLVVFGVLRPDELQTAAAWLHANIISRFGWAYLLAAFIFLVFCLVLAFGPTGRIRLGRDNEKPEYSYFSWFSMMFAAGMGIGLIFWGTAEPLSHFLNPPEQLTGRGGAAATFAMTRCFFHWGFHPWAVYIIMSLSIAYFTFRRKMPPLISSCFYPLLGDRIYGPLGKMIDTFAVFATIFGIATSLGLGALQITEGLSQVFPLPNTIQTTLIIIAAVTVLFMLSSITGVDKGIQILSRSNMILALLLVLFMFLAGPTTYILKVFTSTFGEYLSGLLTMSLSTNPFQGHTWTENWTLFYWAWWIAWSPFVGLFVARISRGRTIREFILGTLLVPSLLTFFWFSVFGGATMYLELEEGVRLVADSQALNVTTVLFDVFDHYHFSTVLSLTAILLLVVFFVTSADSATFVLGMMTTNGNLNPPLSRKVVWGLTESAVAAILLLSGGLQALQQMAIAAALPFTVIMLLLLSSLYKALTGEVKKKR